MPQKKLLISWDLKIEKSLGFFLFGLFVLLLLLF